MTAANPVRPPLVVVGAASGLGRWLVEHLLAARAWDDVTLVDVPSRAPELADLAAELDARATVVASLGPAGLVRGDGRPWTPPAGVLVVLAVPPEALDQAARAVAAVDAASLVVVVAEQLAPALAAVADTVPAAARTGLHPLFERSAPSFEGQTAFVVPPAERGELFQDLVASIRGVGGSVTFGAADRHDAIMTYVQAAAHQTLLNFADVLTRSGLDLETDLWAARTPLFEALFGLVARVLDPRQRATIERIQTTAGAQEAATALEDSARRTLATISASDSISAAMDEIGDRVGGSLFDVARHTASIAVDAVQSRRAELSRRWSSGELVGVRLVRRPEVLHVGRIEDVGPTQVVVHDVLVPGSGRGGALLEGPGHANAKRVGAHGRARDVVLNIGQVRLVTGVELEHELDERLAFVPRDVRFLVPESLSGAGVLAAVRDVAHTRGHTLVSEVVRTGQRAVAVRLAVRADRDVEDTIETLRARVAAVYAWPDGVCRPAVPAVRQVRYLGPPGTFSEVAARRCATAAGVADPELLPVADFGEVLAVPPGAIGVVPISSSSSGLVGRTHAALLGLDDDTVTVAGMVDVPVRMDSYIPAARTMDDLRGAELYSHPQALAQCVGFATRWGLRPVPCASTGEALRLASQATGPALALAAAGADLSGLALKVGEREVDDLSGSITRFLIVGRESSFGELSPQSTPTTRWVWIGRLADAADLVTGASDDAAAADDDAAYTECLSDADGNALVVTSRAGAVARSGGRLLGPTPWSPRTPIVRVAAPPARAATPPPEHPVGHP